METDVVKYPTDDLEDGELSDGSDGGYTPLQRPDIKPLLTDTPPLATGSTPKLVPTAAVADSASESELSLSDDSSSGSDHDIKSLRRGDKPKKKKIKRKRNMGQLQVRPIAVMQTGSTTARPKKYSVWCESLQEDSLMENMRGFDVTKDVMKSDRNVEAYDFSIKYRLNGENRLKRPAGNSSGDDDDNNDFYQETSKRCRFNKGSVKERLGHVARTILDLTVDELDVEEVVARDIANKLCEEKDDLMLRVVEVLGKQKAIDFFKETQRIESEGGMMIINGQRRRTPGGVFLFLIKADTKISEDDKKAVFQDDARKANNDRKFLQASRRDQKVEELKKRLNIQDKEMKPLLARSESLTTRTHLKPDANGTLFNPPPSPVTNSGQDNSPDYSAHAINHVNHDSSPEKVASPDDLLTCYDDDVLDMNCDDMDLF